LKYLTSQAVHRHSAAPTEASMASACFKFKTASSVDDWIAILASVIPCVPVIYFVIDVEVVRPAVRGVSASFWPNAFLRIFKELEKRGIKTLVKVALVSKGLAAVIED
ncbi:uncharacterized protein K452DRAFT_215070, partial [Aplosporella prunicola CBS 121167]